MARLGAPVSIPEFPLPYSHEGARKYDEEIDQILAQFKGVLRFPVADGHAIYVVESFRPLVLRHVPAWDAWAIPDAHIRGLREADVRDMLERERRIAELFSKRKAEG